jgi:hypothetical protein
MANITGTVEHEILAGSIEADRILALDGDDTVQGDSGEDNINGNQGADIINGGDGNDILRGGKGNDSLSGDSGNDVLYGDLGSDTLTGGAGKDRFVIGRRNSAVTTGGRSQADADVITDFTRGEDVIALEGGLNFGDLFIRQGRDELADSAILTDLITGHTLAILSGVNSDDLSFSNFTTAIEPIGPYSGSTEDLGKIDSGIPGFVGPDGAGKVTPNNSVNPIFVGWATGVESYQPAPGVDAQWQTPEKALGPVTGEAIDIVSLGDLDQSQIDAGVAPGQITLSFDTGIRNGAGADFAVFENGFDNRGGIFGELAYVEVSSDGTNFARFESDSLTGEPVAAQQVLDPTGIYNLAGKHQNNASEFQGEFFGSSWGTPFDLETLANNPLVISGQVDLNAIRFVRLIDIPGTGSFLDATGDPIYDSWPTTQPIASGGSDWDAIGVIHAI